MSFCHLLMLRFTVQQIFRVYETASHKEFNHHINNCLFLDESFRKSNLHIIRIRMIPQFSHYSILSGIYRFHRSMKNIFFYDFAMWRWQHKPNFISNTFNRGTRQNTIFGERIFHFFFLFYILIDSRRTWCVKMVVENFQAISTCNIHLHVCRVEETLLPPAIPKYYFETHSPWK